MENFNFGRLFSSGNTNAEDFLKQYNNIWEALPNIEGFIKEYIKTLGENYQEIAPMVFAENTAKIAKTAYIAGPTVIGPNTEVRHCAFIRGNAFIGSNCVVGNSTELKNVIIFNNVQVPHYNYVGDSILGYSSHMGAGSITSNVKSDKTLVSVNTGKEKIPTNLKKFGAILADNVEVGCSSVLNPGTIIEQNSNIYPLSSVRGVVPKNSIFKGTFNIVQKESRQ